MTSSRPDGVGPVGGRLRHRVRATVPVLTTVLVLLGVWLAASYLLLDADRREILLPPPQRVLTDSLLQWSHLRPMLAALGIDVAVSMTGLVVASVLGRRWRS